MKRAGLVLGALVLLLLAGFGWWLLSNPERGTTGEVSTRFRWVAFLMIEV